MKEKKKNQEYHSFEEFINKFYPTSSKERLEIEDSLDQFGTKLAQKSLVTLKQLLTHYKLRERKAEHS